MCYENYLHTLCSILGNLLKVQGVLLSSCQSRMYDRPRRGIVELPASPWYLINHLKQCDIYLHILLYLGLIVIIEGMWFKPAMILLYFIGKMLILEFSCSMQIWNCIHVGNTCFRHIYTTILYRIVSDLHLTCTLLLLQMRCTESRYLSGEGTRQHHCRLKHLWKQRYCLCNERIIPFLSFLKEIDIDALLPIFFVFWLVWQDIDESVWTIDMCYILSNFGVKTELTTKTLGADPAYVGYYSIYIYLKTIDHHHHPLSPVVYTIARPPSSFRNTPW